MVDAEPGLPHFEVGRTRTDEPFPFGHYVAIESARRAFAAAVVHAAHLPYGVWWDRLRPHITLDRGESAAATAALDVVWIDARQCVPLDAADAAATVDAYRDGGALFP